MTTSINSNLTLSEIQIVEICKGFREFIIEYTGVPTSSSTHTGASPNILSNETRSQPTTLYLNKLSNLLQSDEENLALSINFEHLLDFSTTLASAIETYFVRVEPHLNATLYDLSAEFHPEYIKSAIKEGLKPKRFSLIFTDLGVPISLRSIDAKKTGQLITISGVITRTSDVRPELVEASFVCSVCRTEIPKIDQDFRFVYPKRCTKPANEGLGSAPCNNSSDFQLLIKKSVFYDWQRACLQENTNSIPSGCMPRTIEVILRNKLVETVKPGDRCAITGALIAVPDVSQLYSNKEITRGDLAKPNQSEVQGKAGYNKSGPRLLTHKLVFIAYGVQLTNSNQSNIQGDNLEIEEEFKMEDGKVDKKNLINLVAPNIYGHTDVKKGILLMLLGGVEKTTIEKMHLRGNINVLLVGDPSTAKSQLLKSILTLKPRTVYTSGKGSSAAGLTASVVRDEEAGEFVVQAGAMMLADNGVCCIDEFDKMDLNDQSAIHEAMEQQTITITKAGVHATMNSKASVLAACNPLTGRYDRSKPLLKNVDIAPPILSRFDLVFIMVDECDSEIDSKICSHVINKRYNLNKSKQEDKTELINFIKFASLIKPKITEEARKKIVGIYREMRESDAVNRNNCRTTARQLESLIRLSEACAKLDLSQTVTIDHVLEAAELLRKSIVSIRRKEVKLNLNLNSANNENKEEIEIDKENKESEVKISYEDYSKIANALAIWINGEGRKTENDMVHWYISQLADRDMLEGAEETFKLINVTKMVIGRMAEIDNVFLKEEEDGKWYYGLNPNYSVEQGNEVGKFEEMEIERSRKGRKKDKRKEDVEDEEEKDVYDF